jgi:hypothetical protein
MFITQGGSTMKTRFGVRLSTISIAIASCLVGSVSAADKPTPAPASIDISSTVPSDIKGGAGKASLTDAARFAWQEFIALNWAAVKQTGAANTRDTPDTHVKFGDPSYKGPLVWHTFRGKVEIFPGTGLPPGATRNLGGNTYTCNYDVAPQYNYANGLSSTGTPPWINLDENSQIGLDHIFAGAATGAPLPLGTQILFMAKANRTDFDYVCPMGWWLPANLATPQGNTAKQIQKTHTDPAPGAKGLVSFPYGTIEVKAAWRKLGPKEDASRFYTTTVRYYVKDSAVASGIAPVDDTLALVGLHIIQKTPSAPYFIFATFEQADNILDPNGKPVEDVDGKYTGSAVNPLRPDIQSVNATASSGQSFIFTEDEFGETQTQLHFSNVPNTGLVTGTIKVEKREHLIADEVIAVNKEAHAAIKTYLEKNFPKDPKSPWAYYKLVSVQAKPIDKPTAGVTYDKADASTYYQANSTIETDYDLQVFSGQFYPYAPELPNNKGGTLSNTITDFTAEGKPFKNVAYQGSAYNMGGCMGCHGNAQHGGTDFSFILAGGPDTAPDTAGTLAPVIFNKVVKYLQEKK